ncbi:MAG TPA: 30S ribosomal protein S20 [Patescibacteria group bacterium]|nr:30S ribosomal protein S20 [Patescibacteria group bacterium]
MPITKSALKALRQDKKRAIMNQPVRSRVKSSMDAVKAAPKLETLSSAFSALDRAVKRHIIHRNKAARLKSQLSKLVK